ncbi:MAG: helix-turn-helix transcriptional regulator [Campylobacterota bacterium]|nr:helix-turn-helix transcriptional regulator [Campylobacterota bacterium]
MKKVIMEKMIDGLTEHFKTKSKKELAGMLGMSNNALSMLQSRDSIGTLIEKILLIEGADTISIDALLYARNKAQRQKLQSALIKTILPLPLGQKVRYVREALGMNQKEFALKLEAEQGTISRYEQGKRENIDSDFLLKMVSVLNVNPMWLMSDEGEVFVEGGEDES